MDTDYKEISNVALQLFGRVDIKGTELNAAVAVSQMLQGLAQGTLAVKVILNEDALDEKVLTQVANK